MNILDNSNKLADSEEIIFNLGKLQSVEDYDPIIPVSKIQQVNQIFEHYNINSQNSGSNIISEENDNVREEEIVNKNGINKEENTFTTFSPTRIILPIGSNNSPRQSTLYNDHYTIKNKKFFPTNTKSKEKSKYYKKLKYKNVIYKIGEYILIKENETSNMVGKLKKIKDLAGDIEHPDWPMVLVRWYIYIYIYRYYTKKEIDRIINVPNKQYFDSIGNNELFVTNHYDYVFVDTIYGKCTVYIYIY